jgi:hypothetical protein
MSQKHHNVQLTEEYLLKQCEILNLYYNKFPKKIVTSNYYAVLVEPRSDHPLFEAVCKNVMYFLPKNWNLIVYSYDENLVRKRLTNMEFLFYKTSKASFTLEEYSDLLMSLSFWDNIPSENILIFQTDSYITRQITDEYINTIKDYSLIGAVYRYVVIDDKGNNDNMDLCSVNKNRNFSMSGGFSFRNKSAMRDCIKYITLDTIIEYRRKNNLELDIRNMYYEDFYFEHALFLLNYKLPSYNECRLFCSQLHYELVNSYAIHGLYRSYVYQNLIYNLRPSLAEIHDEVLYQINT